MADYSIKNLQEVENSGPRRHRRARGAVRAQAPGLRPPGRQYFRYGPGFRAPYGHRHREQEEAYVVVGGSGRIRLDDDVVDLARWDVVRVAPKVVRGFEGGPDGLEIIAIGADRPEGGDGELVRGWWID